MANATSLHRRSADTRERGWHDRFGLKAAIKTAMDLVRFVSLSIKVHHTPGISL